MNPNPFGIWAISQLHEATIRAALEGNLFKPYWAGHPDVPTSVIEACSTRTEYTIEGYFADRMSMGETLDVPVIPVTGTMMRGYSYDNVFSNSFIIGILANIANNTQKKGVILDFHTGGGQVDGLFEFAAAVQALVSKKPVVASVNFCASGGLWVGSQASEIIMRPGPVASIGSIGTMYMHINRAKALEQQGLEPELFRSTGSVDKNKQNDIEQLDDQTRADIQRHLDVSNKAFKGAVRAGRGSKIKSDEVFTGKLYNAQDAIKLGLADKVGDLTVAYNRVISLSKQYA